MAKKKCCKCCLNLSFQTKFLSIVSFVLIIVIIGFMILILYNMGSFINKEIRKQYDNDEFKELSNIENKLENIHLNIENSFKNILQNILNIYQEFSLIDIINNKNDNFTLKEYSDEGGEESDVKNIMIYKSENDSSTMNEEKVLSYLGIHLKYVFNSENNYNNLIYLLIICDYENQINYFYPGNKTQINIGDFKQDLIKNYSMNRLAQKINEFISLQEILLYDINFYKNLFLLPFFDDDTISLNNFNLSNNIFLNPEVDNLNIYQVSFMILPKENFTITNIENLENSISKIFFLIGIKNIDDIYDNQISNVNLIQSKYLFPYELIYKKDCKKILYLGKDNNNQNIEYNYLDNCFNKEEKIEEYDGYDKYEDYTTYDTILEDYDLFKNIMKDINTYNSSLFNFYRLLEQKKIKEKNTSFTKKISNITIINNINCKTIKVYSPLEIIYEADYFYPINNIKLNILILKEDSVNYLIDKIEEIGSDKIVTGFLFLLLAAFIYLIFIIALLLFSQEEIRKPMERMNVLNNLYYSQINEEGLHIDEFDDLIKSIAFELKYDSDFLNNEENQEDNDIKIEIKNFNKDFEKNKIYNIFVDKDKINKILEESNYSNEIINSTNLSKIQNDISVKKSTLFRECIKMGNFDNFKNNYDNNNIIYNKINFKDKNTLQNVNALFYKMFKLEYDEDYKNNSNEEDEEEKEKKNLSNKKSKNDIINNIINNYEENEKKISNDKDENNINNEK